ncbi:MAG: hypothetical protein KDK36_08930 [Leptospiraceae bacterium]|nr:hypothetical protein [Leptospiraceae bacterium]
MYAENLVNKIEIFQEKHNKLPDSVKDLGEIESENSPAYYIKIDNSNFKVWYGKGLGKSKVYYSKTKEWIDEY